MTSPSLREEKDLENGDRNSAGKRKIDFRSWVVENFDWSWFTCTQSTGGIAATLSLCPKSFPGLQTIGTVVFIFNIVLFLVFVGLQITRWVLQPSLIKKSFTRAPECYFYGSFWLTIATMIICMQEYGVPHAGPWLIVVMRVLFWIYAAVVILSTSIQFVVVFEHVPVKAIEMSPAWFIMVFKVMLTGTVASVIAKDQPPAQRLPIIVAGVAYQGFGWITSMLILAWFLGHLMEKGLPPPSMAPGLFMTVGTSGFTIAALIGNARALPQGYGFLATHPTAIDISQIMALWVSVFMWVFAFWLFNIAFLACLRSVVRKDEHGRWTMPMTFKTTWWAMIFPNVGFTIATIQLGQELESNAVLWVSTIMVIVLVAAWLFDLALMLKTVVLSLENSDVKMS